MKTQTTQPSQNLAHLIKEFSYTSIMANEMKRTDQIVIDDGCYDFVFFKGQETTFSHGADHKIPLTNGVFTIHQLKPPNQLIFNNELELFAAKVQPWANATFFPATLDPGLIYLNSIFSNDMDQLYNEIFETQTIEEKAVILESFIASLKIEENDSFKTVKAICEKIYASNGAIKVNDLVDIFKMNRQLLNKKFKTQVHYTIKQFIKIVRIISLIKYKIKHQEQSLTTVAYHFDYTDQAHFNNDFKKVCGIAPSIFFKNLPAFFHRHKKKGF